MRNSQYYFLWIAFLTSLLVPRCFMALIRGSNGLAPCPVCLVPRDKLSDLSQSFKLRDTVSHTSHIDLENYTTPAKREEKLKELGLQPLEVFNHKIFIIVVKCSYKECILEN